MQELDMRIWRLLKRTILVAMAAGLAAAVYYTPYDPPAWTSGEITHWVDVINEASSVLAPHRSLGDDVRSRNVPLFVKVESGTELTDIETLEYRKLYQEIIFNNQRLFKTYDGQVAVLTDAAPQTANNIGGKGIMGHHDHHDASARANLKLLKENLASIDNASGIAAPWTRVFSAAKAHKNLTDIMLHLGTAPQTVSVQYAPMPVEPGDLLADEFETVLREYKAAQFAPMNSLANVKALHAALDAYDRMVAQVQTRTRAKLGPVERTLAGRWLSWQSLTPPLGSYKAIRFPRKPAVTAAQ
jgi:hypothetical protein